MASLKTDDSDAVALSPRKSAKFIADRSVHVKLSPESIKQASIAIDSDLERLNYSTNSWHGCPVHPQTADEFSLNWIFVVDCLNFSFWLPNGSYSVEYNGATYHGYMALCAAINRALKEDIQITTPSFFQSVSLEDLKHIFRPSEKDDNQIPLLDKRLEHLHEAGRVLVEKYDGKISKFVTSCGKSALKMMNKVSKELMSFCDEGCYEGQKVAIYKRAQILVADIWACFGGKSFGEFTDIDELTMFADYRVPQALQFMQVMKYSEELSEKVRNNEELENGSQMEMEIRGCSIWAVELIKNAVNELRKSSNRNLVNSILVDFYLWDYATEHKDKMAAFPEHRTRCVYY